MGFSLSWLAAQYAGADEVCTGLGLERQGGSCAAPDFDFSGAALPGGWYLVIGDRPGYDFIAHSDLTALSERHDVIVCEVEEHVMYSSAALWRGGACLWKVVHDSEQGIYHLAVEGEPPTAFESVRAGYAALQDAEGGEDADVDFIFEVPLRLARDIAGYKHDEVEIAEQQPRFEELALRKGVKRPKAPPSERPPLWARPLIWLIEWYVRREERRRRR